MIRLGDFYKDGVGVDLDVREARRWYELAAAAGNEDAPAALDELDVAEAGAR